MFFGCVEVDDVDEWRWRGRWRLRLRFLVTRVKGMQGLANGDRGGGVFLSLMESFSGCFLVDFEGYFCLGLCRLGCKLVFISLGAEVKIKINK